MADTFYGPRSRENARLLLKAAEELGYEPQVVRTTSGGYNAPEDVVEAVLGVSDIEEGKDYPAPDEGADGIPVLTNEAGDQDTSQAEEVETELVRPHNGASKADWVKYAESVGVEVTEDDTRDGLIEKVDAKEGNN